MRGREKGLRQMSAALLCVKSEDSMLFEKHLFSFVSQLRSSSGLAFLWPTGNLWWAR